MKKALLAITFLALTQAAMALEPKVVIRSVDSAPANTLVTIRLSGTVSETPVVIEAATKPTAAEDDSLDFVLFGNAKKPAFALVIPSEPGTYVFAAIATGKVKDEGGNVVERKAYGFTTVKVVGKKPKPPTPTPIPVPDPIPTPFPPNPFPPTPDPEPTPTPIPVPDTGDQRVLILWESSQGMTTRQRTLMNSAWLIKYLNETTVKDSKGRGGWRRWDIDTSIASEGPEWEQMLTAAKAELTKPSAPSLPVIVVFRGTKGKAYPFPEENLQLMTILKR